jgi:hypothetical protein
VSRSGKFCADIGGFWENFAASDGAPGDRFVSFRFDPFQQWFNVA